MNNFILPVPMPNLSAQSSFGPAGPGRAPEGIGFKEIMAASMAGSSGLEVANPIPGDVTQKIAAAVQELAGAGQDGGMLQQLRSRILAELSVALGRDIHNARGDPPYAAAPPGAEPGRQPGSLDRIAGGAKPVDGESQAGDKLGTGQIMTAFANELQAKAAPGAAELPASQPGSNPPYSLEEAAQVTDPGSRMMPQILAHQLAAQSPNGFQGAEHPVLWAGQFAGDVVPAEAASEPVTLDFANAARIQAENALAAGGTWSENQPGLNTAGIIVPRPAADAPVSQPVPAVATEPGPADPPSTQLLAANATRMELGAPAQIGPDATAESGPADAGQRPLLDGARALRQAGRETLDGKAADPGFAHALSAGRIGPDGSPAPVMPAAVQVALDQIAREAAAMPAREVRDLTLELDTAGLGRVTVRLALRDAEGLVVEIRAGSDLAARALRAELPQLAQMLERHNLAAGTQLSVTSSSGFENDPNQARYQPWWFEHVGSGPTVEDQGAGVPGPGAQFHLRWHWAVDLLA